MTVLKYVGKSFLPNVPARDIREDEAKQYDLDKLVKSGLYIRVSKPKSGSKKKISETPEPEKEVEKSEEENK